MSHSSNKQQWIERANRVVDLVAAARDDSARARTRVVPDITPEEGVRLWRQHLENGGNELVDLLEEMISCSTRMHHPGYVGHQVNPPDLDATLTQLVVSALNMSSAIHEMAPAGTMIEHTTVRWMCDQIGFGPEAGGVFCSGGSLGNLTSLLAMRQSKANFDAWTDGSHAGQPMCVLVSSEAHYSIDRAVRIMGWGKDGAIPVNIDANRSLDPSDLAPAMERAHAIGRRVVGVVASACTTPTGAFDPLSAIADFCAEHDLWMHVDGAHGASLVLSEQHKHRLEGIERADSVVWDAHKMLGVHMLSTGVLYRDETLAHGAFAQDAVYMFTKSASQEWYSPAHKAFECTKGSIAAPFYMRLATQGRDSLTRSVDRQMELAQELARKVDASELFELVTEPQCNIVCFHVKREGMTEDEHNAYHQDVRDAVINEGHHYMTQARLDGRFCLRCTMMYDKIQPEDLDSLLESIGRHAQTQAAST